MLEDHLLLPPLRTASIGDEGKIAICTTDRETWRLKGGARGRKGCAIVL